MKSKWKARQLKQTERCLVLGHLLSPTPVFLPGEFPGMVEPGGLPSMGLHGQTWLKRLSSSSSSILYQPWLVWECVFIICLLFECFHFSLLLFCLLKFKSVKWPAVEMVCLKCFEPELRCTWVWLLTVPLSSFEPWISHLAFLRLKFLV